MRNLDWQNCQKVQWRIWGSFPCELNHDTASFIRSQEMYYKSYKVITYVVDSKTCYMRRQWPWKKTWWLVPTGIPLTMKYCLLNSSRRMSTIYCIDWRINCAPRPTEGTSIFRLIWTSFSGLVIWKYLFFVSVYFHFCFHKLLVTPTLLNY